MESFGYYPQTTITTTGQYSPTATFSYYPQIANTAMDQRATVEQLEKEFLKQTKNQQPTSPRRKSSNPNLRGPLSENYLAIGTIVFVQSKLPGTKNCTCVLPDCQRRHLDDRGYNHPAVVLDIRDDRLNGGELTALCCTISANPQPNPQEKASGFTITQIPKGNSESPTTAPNGATVLYLEPESTMYKKSHIYDSHVYAIPVSQLTNFGNKPHQNRLAKESYKALIANFKSITPRKWIKTAKLVVGERALATLSSPLPIPTPATAPAPLPITSPAALPVELQQTIDGLLQYLTKQQVLEAVPEMIDLYPQLLTVLA